MRVTAEVLRSRHACEDQVLMFERLSLYNRGVIDLKGKFLEEWCVACATCFDWFWCAQRLLPIPVFQAWLDEDHKPAAEAYMASIHRNQGQGAAWREYKLTTAISFARRAEGCPDPTVLRIQDTTERLYYPSFGVTSHQDQQEDET